MVFKRKLIEDHHDGFKEMETNVKKNGSSSGRSENINILR